MIVFIKKYILFFKKIFFLLGSDITKIPFFIFLFLVMSLLDVLGIGLIIPYISMVSNPDSGINILSNILPFFQISEYQNEEIVLFFGSLMVFVFIIKGIFSIIINKAIFRFCLQNGVNLRMRLMKLYQDMPYEHYIQRNSSEYILSLQQLAPNFSQGVLLSLMKLISETIVAVAILIFLFWTNGQIMLFLVSILSATYLAYNSIFKERIKLYGQLMNQYYANLVKNIQESITGLKEIRTLKREQYFLNKFGNNAKNFSDIYVKHKVITLLPRHLIDVISVIFVVTLVSLFFIFNLDKESLFPILTVFGVALIRLIPIFTQTVGGVNQIRFGIDTVNKLSNDITMLEGANTLHEDMSKGLIKDASFESLELRNVSYKYKNANRNSLSNVSLNINKDDSIGIIGSSGSGKSTLVDMILGFLEPESGVIVLNGNKRQEFNGGLGLNIAYLPQKVFLIDDTISHNVALGVSEVDIDYNLVDKSLQKANLFKYIQSLEDGVNSMVGESGVSLSGGQAQRVALARAFYHGQNVLVFDESTSALDEETETEIINEVKRLQGERTIIIISHRPSILTHCNHIIKLKEGRIIEQGSYEVIIGSKYKSD
jgi:ATP-binding cassette, subfamily B, bacterial PglK